MLEEQPAYASYLLRLRCSNGELGQVWRASLESTRSGEIRHFANLQELITFLNSQFQEGPPANEENENTGN